MGLFCSPEDSEEIWGVEIYKDIDPYVLIPYLKISFLPNSGFDFNIADLLGIDNSVFTAALLPYNLSSGPQLQEVLSLKLVINHSCLSLITAILFHCS